MPVLKPDQFTEQEKKILWELRVPAARMPGGKDNYLAEELNISTFLLGILQGRGLCSAEEINRFLTPGLRHLPHPDKLPGAEEAAKFIAGEIEKNHCLAIFGDYDVDGICSAALLHDFLIARAGQAPLIRLPSRTDGYGITPLAVEALFQEGAKTIITVDCGIAAHPALERARELGVNVVVTDHHIPPAELPKAKVFVNPKMPGTDAELEELAGVGVAFYLAAALNKILPGTPLDLRIFLDLVALGTIADVVSLRGANRILAKNGLLLLSEAKRPGIAALKEVSGLSGRAKLSERQVSFALAPRINAAGRMSSPDKALELLIGKDPRQAAALAKALDRENNKRKDLEEKIWIQAQEQALFHLQGASEGLRCSGLVLCDPNWHPGVMGIVASRLAETWNRPTILLTSDGKMLKGSGRSALEVDLHAALKGCAELLDSFGGHKGAAGLALLPDNLEKLRDKFQEAILRQANSITLNSKITLDGELSLAEIDYPLVKELEMLQPFGQDNPEPVFVSPPLSVIYGKTFGKKAQHLSLELREQGGRRVLRGKAFGQAKRFKANELSGRRVRVAFYPRIDTYAGLDDIELYLVDLKTV